MSAPAGGLRLGLAAAARAMRPMTGRAFLKSLARKLGALVEEQRRSKDEAAPDTTTGVAIDASKGTPQTRRSGCESPTKPSLRVHTARIERMREENMTIKQLTKKAPNESATAAREGGK